MKSSIIVFLAVAAQLADANSFLSHKHTNSTLLAVPVMDRNLTETRKQAIIAEIDEALGHGNNHRVTEVRVAQLEDRLEPMLAALPRNVNGHFDHSVVRYALHRLFVQTHGWFVRGLEPNGESWNASSPLEALKMGAPEYVQAIFEKRLGGHGAEAHDIAILAAILENMAFEESVERLRSAYACFGFDADFAFVNREEASNILDAFMMAYVLGEDLAEIVPGTALTEMAEKGKLYSGWEDTREFVREVFEDIMPDRRNVTFSDPRSSTFRDVFKVVVAISERYGRWQDHECKVLKKDLFALEDDGAGRVQLANFYKHSLHTGDEQFSESPAYLRQLGALDESDPLNLRIIVSNYILSPSNCMAFSSYYSVCCMDECEDLRSHLEIQIQAPETDPGSIAALVADLPSASQPANRTLSPSLLRRLDSIAAHNGGNVPLHGRLFAQWLHHAYPKECPFPHVTGTTVPRREEDYFEGEGVSADASEEEMVQYIDAANAFHDAGLHKWGSDENDDIAPWIHKEELLHTELPKAPPSGVSRDVVSVLIALGVIAVTASKNKASSVVSWGSPITPTKISEAANQAKHSPGSLYV